MAKKEEQKEPTLVLDEKEYKINSMKDEEKLVVAHINDLNRKIDNAKFNLQQMEMGRQSFVSNLKNSLEAEES